MGYFFSGEDTTRFIYGIPNKFMRQGIFKKIRDSDIIKRENTNNTNELDLANNQTCGVRIRFLIDADYFIFKCHLERTWAYTKMNLFNSSGFDIYQKTDNSFRHRTVVAPEQGRAYFMEKIDIVPKETVEIYLPNYNHIVDLAIGHVDGSDIETAPEYLHTVPIIFYGNSVTQGAAASRSGNAFPNIVSRKLDCDILNYSFLGACKGESSMAAIIAENDMSAMIIDYTRNAPSITEFRDRIDRFYHIIRERFPAIPIILLDGFTVQQHLMTT